MSAEATASELGREARRAARSRWVGWAGRLGLVAQGFSFALVGVLAIAVAAGVRGETESREGALETLSRTPVGAVALVLLAAGFAGYAAWRLAEAFLDRGGDGSDAAGLGKRAAAAGKAAIYIGLTVVSISILVEGRDGGGGGSEDQATAGVLDWPGGRLIVGAVALAIVGVAGFQAYRAVSRGFMDDMKDWTMSDSERHAVEKLGIVGLSARAIVFGLIGAFLLKAAIQFDPNEAISLDGAPSKLAHAPSGPWLLGVTAAGLAAFGLFCAAQARYRRV
jgi:hypothetical protein